jgi:type I thyroxine 5'-deiodinase
VYIQEAHPVDLWQVKSNVRDGVLFASPKTDGERVDTANACVVKLAIKIPALLDAIDNRAERAYTGWPDRLYVIGTDGRVRYKSAPGPFGFSTSELDQALGRMLPGQHADERELLKLETVWNEGHERGDTDALDRLWSEDLEVAVPRMAPMTKAVVLQFSRSGSMTFQRYQTSDLRVRVYGDAAVTTGRLKRARMLNGRTVEDDWLFTKTYMRRGGRWQVVAFHAADAPAPEPH